MPRLTATRYLGLMADAAFVQKIKVGRSNSYVNVAQATMLTRPRLVGCVDPRRANIQLRPGIPWPTRRRPPWHSPPRLAHAPADGQRGAQVRDGDAASLGVRYDRSTPRALDASLCTRPQGSCVFATPNAGLPPWSAT